MSTAPMQTDEKSTGSTEAKGKREGPVQVMVIRATADKIELKSFECAVSKENREGILTQFKRNVYNEPKLFLEHKQIGPQMILLFPEYPHDSQGKKRPFNKLLAAAGCPWKIYGDAIIYKSETVEPEGDDDEEKEQEEEEESYDVHFDCTQADVDALANTFKVDLAHREAATRKLMAESYAQGIHVIVC